LSGIYIHTPKAVGKTENKMGGRRPKGHFTGPRNKRMEKTSKRQRRIEVSCEGGHVPEWAVAPQVEWNIYALYINVHVYIYDFRCAFLYMRYMFVVDPVS